MQKISMLGSGFIGRFYTDSLHGYLEGKKVRKNLLKIIMCLTGLLTWKNQYQDLRLT